jgi:hypothetical protein
MTHTNVQSQPSVESFVSPRARDPVSIGGLLIVFGVITITGTTRDLLIAAPLLLAAGVIPAPIAFVAGQLAVVPTITLEDTLLVGVTQLALLCVLTEPARGQKLWAAFIGTLLAYGLLVGVVAIGFREGLVVAGGLLCGTVAVGTYLARRVTLVRLGRVALDLTPSADEAGGAETTATAMSAEAMSGEASLDDPNPDADPSSSPSEAASPISNDDREPKE